MYSYAFIGSRIPSFSWLLLSFAHFMANSDVSFRIGMKFAANALLLPPVLVPTIWSIGIWTSPKGTSENVPLVGIISSNTSSVGSCPWSIRDW